MPSQDGVAAEQFQDPATESSATAVFDERRHGTRHLTHAASIPSTGLNEDFPSGGRESSGSSLQEPRTHVRRSERLSFGRARYLSWSDLTDERHRVRNLPQIT